MAEYVYVMKGLSKTVPGGKKILDDIWLSFLPGAKIGVIGPNGSGKSSLMRIMAGVDTEFDGEAWPGKGVSVGYLPQEPELDETRTVRENVMDALAGPVALIEEYNALTMQLAEPMDDDAMQKVYDRMAVVQDAIDAADAWDVERTVEIAMDALRVPDGDADVRTLSGGERRRVALCRLLLTKPDLLLLDEPTNHLDADTVGWLQRHLNEYPGTVIAITHDRYFLDEVAGWILEVDRGRGYPFEGNYSGWLEQKRARLAKEEKEESSRQKQLAEEAEYVKQTPQGRRTRARARVAAYETLLNAERPKQVTKPIIMIPPGPRLGNIVVEAEGIAKGFGDRLLYDDLSFALPPGAIVGIIGPNGAGKTTLFRMIATAAGAAQGDDVITPDEGTLRVGETVVLSYLDQSRAGLDASKSVFEEITGGGDWVQLGKTEMASRAYCAAFGFIGSEQQKPVGSCSGGERNRIQLAKLLQEEANLLLLDEPTNDLDVDTLRSLEEAVLDFAGCVVVTSHDRWFLDRVATHILAFEGDSEVTWFPGGYSEYAEDLQRRKGADALNPTRVRYKPLTRR
ncbi:MAG: energy-dependent translational throttle protein EttA [Actinomycetota bacterium]|nr:energy-dependent translational throttle protein EttA [Actinomycetota bacterium]